MSQKRNTEYSHEFKLDVIEYALEHTGSQASRRFDVPTKTVSRWVNAYRNDEPLYNNGRRYAEQLDTVTGDVTTIQITRNTKTAMRNQRIMNAIQTLLEELQHEP